MRRMVRTLGKKMLFGGIVPVILLLCLAIVPVMAAETDLDSEEPDVSEDIVVYASADVEDTVSDVAAYKTAGVETTAAMNEGASVVSDGEEPSAVAYAEEASEEPTDPEEQTIVYKISLDQFSLSFSLSVKTAQLVATVTTEDGDKGKDAEVTWNSEKPSVATVSASGLVTPKADGTTKITASVGDVSASCTVTVSFYNGVYQDPDGSGNWYYYKNGKVDTGKTEGVECKAKGEKAWWSVEKGVVKSKYTGFAQDGSTWWYISEGKKATTRNDIIKDTSGKIGSKGDWWYVVGGKVQTGFTGLSNYKNSNGWWYIKNGKVDFTYNGLAKNKNGWWYVKNGKVDFTHNGYDKNENGWWYVVGGKVQSNYTGVGNVKNSHGWWYVKKGKVNFKYTGISSNKNGFWYVRNGKVDFSYSGSYQVGDLKYTIKKGKVDPDVSYYNKTLTGGTLKMLTGNKGLLLSRTLTQDEFYQVVNEFMKDSFVRNTKYRMVAASNVYNGGSRWDCSSMTQYFMNYYLLTYDQAYSAAKKANPSAQKSALTSKALSSVGKLASETRLTPSNAVSQALSWGNPVYTYKTVGQLSADNPGDLRYGDLLFFGKNDGDSVRITHVAVYLGQYYLDSGDTGYYILENTDSALGVVKEGRSDGVRIASFDPTRTSSVLVHATRIF